MMASFVCADRNRMSRDDLQEYNTFFISLNNVYSYTYSILFAWFATCRGFPYSVQMLNVGTPPVSSRSRQPIVVGLSFKIGSVQLMSENTFEDGHVASAYFRRRPASTRY